MLGVFLLFGGIFGLIFLAGSSGSVEVTQPTQLTQPVGTMPSVLGRDNTIQQMYEAENSIRAPILSAGTSQFVAPIVAAATMQENNPLAIPDISTVTKVEIALNAAEKNAALIAAARQNAADATAANQAALTKAQNEARAAEEAATAARRSTALAAANAATQEAKTRAIQEQLSAKIARTMVGRNLNM
jgi:hypothetical protein